MKLFFFYLSDNLSIKCYRQLHKLLMRNKAFLTRMLADLARAAVHAWSPLLRALIRIPVSGLS